MKNSIFRRTASCIRFALGMVIVAGLAYPAAIPIFNTGVDAGANVLPNGTIGDPHYTLITVPGGTTAVQVDDFRQWIPDRTLVGR